MSDGSLRFMAPRTSGPATGLGVVLALVLLAVGVVLVHDALALFRVLHGPDWVTAWARQIGTVRPVPSTAWVGVGLVVLGLVLVVAAVIPRRRFGWPLNAGAGLYMRDKDVAVLASAAARRVDGVLDARSTVGRRTVTVDVRTTGDAGTGEAVRAEVGRFLELLEPPPTVNVRTRGPRP